MRYVLGAIDTARDGYVAVVSRLAGVAIVFLVAVALVVVTSVLLFGRTPQSFLPDEDQGAIFAALRLPEGASINRTTAVVKQVEDIVKPIPGVQGAFVVGLNFIDYVAASNQAFFVIRLKPYEDRTDLLKALRLLLPACGCNLLRLKGRLYYRSPAAYTRIGQHRRLPICPRGTAGTVAYSFSRGPSRAPRLCAFSARACRGICPLTAPTRRKSIWISIATRLKSSASRSATFSTPCNQHWAVSTSTTSIFSVVPGR